MEIEEVNIVSREFREESRDLLVKGRWIFFVFFRYISRKEVEGVVKILES